MKSLAGLIFLTLLLALVGCGGSGAGGGGGIQTITDTQRDTVMTSLETTLAGLGSVDASTKANAMVNAMRAMPEFKEAGITGDLCAYGLFKDDRLIVSINNRPPAAETLVQTILDWLLDH
ncbi:MAG: hypothetical protein JST35_01320 [Armatimonadetes bacterium]|nr:hypothetical protein [Armatimonadota bacterium]